MFHRNHGLFKSVRAVVLGFGSAAVLSFVSSSAIAGPYGFDLHNVLSPRAGGMAGTAIAGSSNGPVEAVYGNPANLTDFQGGTDFTFGATFYYPRATATVQQPLLVREGIPDGIIPRSGPTTSGAEFYTIPQIAVTQDLAGVGIPIVLGLGVSAVSGIGVDWRRNPKTLGAAAEFIVLGINAGAGYQVTDRLDLGLAVTISYGMLEAGLAGTSGQGHDYGVRLTLGGEYDLTDSTELGFYYQTELEHNWNDMMLVSHSEDIRGADYLTLKVQQPANVGIGISHQLNENWRVAADYIYKAWDNAEFWKRFYKDQNVFSLGVEYTDGPWTLRGGYGYAEDPTRNINGVDLGALQGYEYVCTGSTNGGGGFGACLPLVGTGEANQVWTWLQAMETPVIYRHRLTAGFTYEGFLAPFLALDAHVAHQLHESRQYSGGGVTNHTKLDVKSYHAGFALTWSF